jgi:AcrR family transcriptional regulator
MANKYNDSQNKITRESIFTALMILMEQRNFKEISITDITKKAGVSRMAFYRNYSVKEDIISIFIDELLREYSMEILNDKVIDINKNLQLYFSYFRKHEKLINNLIKSNMINMILEKCIEAFYVLSQNIVCTKAYSSEKQNYWIKYKAGGLYNVLIEWAKGGMKQSDEYMGKIVSEFIDD